MSHIVQAQGLKLDRQRLNDRLDDLVANYPNPDEARRAYQQNPEAMRQLESQVLEDQAVDWVLAAARTTERAMSFKELTGFGPGARDEQQQAQHSEVSGT
jgi:trigger factor